MKILTAFSLILTSFISQLLASDLITYQGKLTDAQGEALPSGQYRVGIRIWEAALAPAANPENEVPLWARKYDVPVQDGVFSLMIGAAGLPWAHTPAALTESLKLALSSGNRFLDITVMSDANGAEKPANQWQTLAPRQSLNAVPYAMNGVPTGTVVPFAGATPPDGWVSCDGSTLATADPRYARLAATVGSAFNTGGEPSGHFRLPDMRGRTAIGRGQGDTWAGAGAATNWLLGQKFGAEKHVLTQAEMPSHSHSYNDPGHHHNWGPSQRAPQHYGSGSVRTAYDHHAGGFGEVTTSSKTNIVINVAGNDQPHNNMQPSLVLTYIIKL
jgi:microcystin-dependent protein